MSALHRWLDRFCARHPGFGIPNLMKYIVIGNVVVFLLDQFSNGLCSALLSFSPAAIAQGQVWRVVSFVFIPVSSGSTFFSRVILLAISLYFYWFIGNIL